MNLFYTTMRPETSWQSELFCQIWLTYIYRNAYHRNACYPNCCKFNFFSAYTINSWFQLLLNLGWYFAQKSVENTNCEMYWHKKKLQLLTFLYCTIFPTAWQCLNTSFTASKSSLMALAMSLVHKENLGTMSISLFVYLFIYLQCDREINQQGSGSPTASVRQAIWEVSQKFRHALVPLIIPHAHQPKNITSILSST